MSRPPGGRRYAANVDGPPAFDRRVYQRSEVIYLRGLGPDAHADDPDCECGRCEARYLSQGWKDSLLQGDGGSNAEETLPLIARWHDIKAAMLTVTKEKRDREVMQLRASGYTEDDIARITGLSRSMVRRRFEAKVVELIEELGGEYVEPPRVSVPSKCLECGVGERVYLVPTFGEVWTCIGWRRDEADGKLCQAWQARADVMICRRAIATAARPGDAYWLTWTWPRGERGRIAAHTEAPDHSLPESHPWVQAWQRDTQAAHDDRPAPVRTWRVPTEVRDADRGRESALCSDCILPRFRTRVEQSRRAARQ